MPEQHGEKTVSDEVKTNLLAFSRLLALLPDNVVNRRFVGPLAAMELTRVVKVLLAEGYKLSRSNGHDTLPLAQITWREGRDEIVLEVGAVFRVAWVVFQRVGLPAFDHILVALAQEDEPRPVLICSSLSPLLEPEGLRLLASHCVRIQAGKGQPEDLRNELEAVAAMMLQGNPFGSPES